MDGTSRPGEQTRRAHETRDANIRNLLIFGVCLTLMVVAGLVVSRSVFHHYASSQGLGPPASPFENVRTLPSGPRLQVAAPQDLKHYKSAQDEILTSYGWVDRQAGVVRIPIERAMDILLQRGLPVRATTPEKQVAPKPSGKPADAGKALPG